MATKMVNGVEVPMTPQEEAAFEASRQRTVAKAKAQAKQAITRKLKAELDEDNFLDVANPATRITAARQNARQLWAAVKAANTVAEVDAVDLNAGW